MQHITAARHHPEYVVRSLVAAPTSRKQVITPAGHLTRRVQATRQQSQRKASQQPGASASAQDMWASHANTTCSHSAQSQVRPSVRQDPNIGTVSQGQVSSTRPSQQHDQLRATHNPHKCMHWRLAIILVMTNYCIFVSGIDSGNALSHLSHSYMTAQSRAALPTDNT